MKAPADFIAPNGASVTIQDIALVANEGVFVSIHCTGLITEIIGVSRNRHDRDQVQGAGIRTNDEEMATIRIMCRTGRDQDRPALVRRFSHRRSEIREETIDPAMIVDHLTMRIGILDTEILKDAAHRDRRGTAIRVFPLRHIIRIMRPVPQDVFVHVPEVLPHLVETGDFSIA